MATEAIAGVGFADVAAAAERIKPLVHRTPVLTSRMFDAQAGVQTFLKAENLQHGGSFKLRGASNFVFSIPEADRPRGVVAFSSGNHAQAVAIAAKHVGIPATIVMPTDAPRNKLEATKSRGARIITYDREREDREAIGRSVSAETGATLIPPFDHPWIIAGQGTTGLELVEEVPDLDALVVCLGGGGLLSGCALAARQRNPKIRIFGVEPAAGNDYVLSRQAGHPVEIPTPATIADGLRTTKPGKLTFAIIQQLVEDILVVSDEEMKETMRFLLARGKTLVEPSGAAAAAAVLFGKLPAGIRRVGVTLSGGNVDLDQLGQICSEPSALLGQ